MLGWPAAARAQRHGAHGGAQAVLSSSNTDHSHSPLARLSNDVALRLPECVGFCSPAPELAPRKLTAPFRLVPGPSRDWRRPDSERSLDLGRCRRHLLECLAD